MTDNFSYTESMRRYLSMTITLLIGVFISIISFISVLNNNMDALKDKFFYESSLQTENLRNNLSGYQRALELTKGFFESSNIVTKQEFDNFIQPLFNKGSFSSIIWLESKEIDKTPYKITFYSIKKGYEHSIDINSFQDLIVYPEITDGIKKVKTTGNATIIKNVKLASNTQNDFVFIYPVRQEDKIKGLVIGVLDFRAVVKKSFSSGDISTLRNIYIYDQNNLFFNLHNDKPYFNTESALSITKENIIKQSAFHHQDNIEIITDKWVILFTPTSSYIALATDWYPWFILSLGIIITGAFGILIFNLIGRNLQTEQAVKVAVKELKYSKQHIEAVFNTALEGIIVINTKGIIQAFNPAAENIFGYKKSEVLGKNVSMLMPKENSIHHDQYIKNYLITGQAKIIGIGREVEAKRKDGTKFSMWLGITRTALENENIFVGVVRDVTNEKEAKNKLEEYNTRLEQAWSEASKANKAKSEFLATMSHEIRTPMNGIIGMAELLSYSNLSSQQAKYVETIQSSGDLLLVLINDILDFSKIEAGELELERIPVVINALLSEVIQLLSSRARDNNVELAVRNAQDIPMAIWGDPVRLRQILINLIGNAIKFSKGGYVLVNIQKINQDKNSLTLRFEVKDNGIGIPVEKQRVIFEQFAQVDSSTTREFGGTGLGLAICQRLVSLMGGDIGVTSKEGDGSTFWFEIPAIVHTSHTQTKLEIKRKLKNARILIVDDRPINLEILEEYLNKVGVNCDIADSAERALQILRQGKVNNTPYDIILVDYDMPKMNGQELGRIVTGNPDEYGNPRKILITALDHSDKTEFLEYAGYNTKLIKPIYPSTLINTMLRVLDNTSIKASNNNPINTKQNKNTLPTYKATTLVVEDFEPNRYVAKKILETLGCLVDTAKDGREAIDAVKNKKEKYDLIFMDCQMPNMDGYEATREIRKHKLGKYTKIIALTANAVQGDKEKCLNAGMDSYISKPVKMADIKTMLDRFLKNNAA